ncbi:MAG: MarR family transcriptional regulator [Spirochaetales bacterium]|nr:MarR family transcriptional regulator [Spirochaetales bacterium]
MKNLSSDIFREIGALSRMIQTMSDTAFKTCNLQKGQFVFITRICEQPGMSHAQLTQLLHIDKGTTTKAIQKLVKAGYVEKRQDQKDSRMQRLYPTKAAKEIYKDLIDKEESFIAVSFRGFSKTEIQQVTALIKRMQTNIEKEWSLEKSRGGSL